MSLHVGGRGPGHLVRTGAFAPDALVALDFQLQEYRVGSGSYYIRDLNALTGWSFTRASTGYALNSSGTLVSFGSGVPRITDLGLLDELSATNLILQSQNFTDTWSPGHAGVGADAVVTANAGAAPDGTNTASRIQLSLSGGTSSSDQSFIGQSVIVASATAYAQTVWLKSNTGSTYSALLVDSASPDSVAITITPTWHRFALSKTTASTSYGFRFGLRGAQTPVNSNTADILAWGAQLETGTAASSYIVTTSATAFRAADALTLTYTPAGSAATVTYGTNSTASVSPTSPINLGSSSGGAWVGNYIRKLVVTP